MPIPEAIVSRRFSSLILAIAALVIALELVGCSAETAEPDETDAERLAKLWTAPYSQTGSYHYVAKDELERVWDVAVQLPNRWRVVTPDGLRVSDGQREFTYTRVGNFYSEGPAGATLFGLFGLELPLEISNPVSLKSQIQTVVDSGGTWSVTRDKHAGRPVDVIQLTVATPDVGPATVTIKVDTEFFFVLEQRLEAGARSSSVVVASIEYNPTFTEGTFEFEPPPGSCLRPLMGSC